MARRSPLPVPTEHEEQKRLFQEAALRARRHPEWALLYAVPNAAKRSPALAAYMAAEGLRSGIPDICLPVPRGEYHGFYGELKRQRGGTLQPEQREWLEALRAQGYFANVYRGCDEALRAIEAYLSLGEGEAI